MVWQSAIRKAGRLYAATDYAAAGDFILSKKYKVIIRKCEDYADTDTIRGIIRDGLQELGEKPHGKILLKPNLIFAHRQYGRFGFTEPRVVESIIDVMGAMPDVERITIGERTVVTPLARDAGEADKVFVYASWRG